MIDLVQQFHHRYRHILRTLLRFLTYLAAFFLGSLAYWVNENFGEPSLEQVLYHVRFGMEGLVDTDQGLIKSFVQFCLLLPFSVALILAVIELSIGLYLTHGTKHKITFLVSRANKRLLKMIYWMIGHRAPLYVLLAAFIYFGGQFSILAFLHNQFGRDYFSENYVYPAKVKVTLKTKPKNLVLIYVESLEDSYKNADLFNSNLLVSLDTLKGTSFRNYRQAPGTGWTIAGITATQCGVPLKSVSLYDGNDQGQNIKTFLPKAVCLGDMLHDFGYHNVYMGGDALSFSGKGKFFEDHHYDEIYGREELKGTLTKNDMNYWGLYDDDLLAMVKTRLKLLHASKQPFNLTFTTIDTHGPDGHYSKLCKRHGIKDFTGVVECTARQVADLVQFIKKNGYLKDTNVVILGDHLAMSNPVSEKLSTLPERYVFNSLVSHKPASKNREEVLHFDMFPTIIEFLGFNVEGGRLGLGYTAISKDSAMPPPNEFEEMSENLLNESDKYLELWEPKEGEKIPN